MIVDKGNSTTYDSRVPSLHSNIRLSTLSRSVHAKVALIDDDVVIVGSQNWSDNGFFKNVELSIATNWAQTCSSGSGHTRSHSTETRSSAPSSCGVFAASA